MKPMVMVVDDRVENLKMLDKILSENYEVITCCGGGEAIYLLIHADRLPDAILLDIVMPDIDGFRVMQTLQNHHQLRGIPVICITMADMEEQALILGAADYISKPFRPAAVRLRVENQLRLARHLNELEDLVQEKVREVVETRDNVLVVMADIIEYRNIETGSHVRRVARYADILLDMLQNGSPYADEIHQIGADVITKAVPMHDVGKIGIPDRILLKPAPLDDEERDIMQTHTGIGRSIIRSILQTSEENSEFLQCCADIAYSHHEWYDGSGYPEGLKGEDIPLSARVMAVADVYDALVTKRVYKEAFDHEEAKRMIREGAGTHFDPVVAEAFSHTCERCYAASQDIGVPLS